MSRPDFKTLSEGQRRLVPGGVDLATSLRPLKDGIIPQDPELPVRPAPRDRT